MNTALGKFAVVGSGAAALGVLAGILHKRPDAEVTMFDVGSMSRSRSSEGRPSGFLKSWQIT